MPIDAVSVLCTQLTRDLLAIARLLFYMHCYAYWLMLQSTVWLVTLIGWQVSQMFSGKMVR